MNKLLDQYLRHVEIEAHDGFVCPECEEVGYAIILDLPSGLRIMGVSEDFSSALAAMAMKYAEVFAS